ncbi:MAG TPA: cupin domain-containing protein [Blastocatellia bacterium]|nr:cupin domain-containing protein [Blastocatellia bacterium]
MKEAGLTIGKWAGLGIAAVFAALAGNYLARGECSPLRLADIPPLVSKPVEAHISYSHALPKMDGDHLKVNIVEVTYGPGESSKPHSHPCPVIGYVIEGAVRIQVKGEPEMTYKAGESFYEAPNGVHAVSANASDKEPARFLAYFVCDHETPLTVPAPAAKSDQRSAVSDQPRSPTLYFETLSLETKSLETKSMKTKENL